MLTSFTFAIKLYTVCNTYCSIYDWSEIKLKVSSFPFIPSPILCLIFSILPPSLPTFTLLPSEQPPPHPMRGPHSSLDDTAINNNNSNDFHFYALNLEPRIDPKIKERANIAIRNAAFQAAFPEVSCAQSCSKLCRNCCEFEPCKYPGDNSAASFTPEMKSARTQGVAMLKTLLFPAVPRLLRDVWIAIELVVTIYQLVLSSISLSLNHVETFNITYVVLASIALILAVLDALIHLGSCAATVFYCRSNSNNPTQHKDEQCSIDPGNIQDCCLLSKIHRQQASEYSDIVRNIVTELIFYPLLICNMFDFIVSGSYRRQDSAEKINFSLFVVGGFYLVLSVYIARFFMITFSLMSLRKVPESIAYTQRFYWNLTIKFGLHVLLQLIVSVFIIAAIGVGIHNENESPCDEGTCIKASPYLISAAVVGGIIPILGTCMFLLTNGHNFRAMTVSLWVDMISMLQYESFATAVFGNEGVKKAKEKVEAFTKHVKFAETKKQLKLFVTSTPFMVKRLYPLRSPFFWFVSILYIVLLGSFFATLLVSFECSVLNRDKLHLGIVFFITAFAALLANIHVITLTIVFTAIVFISLLLVALTPVFVLLGLVLYVPLGCCFSCLVYLHDMAKETSVFSKPAVHTRRIRSALHKTRT